jgi:hypothetical protein
MTMTVIGRMKTIYHRSSLLLGADALGWRMMWTKPGIVDIHQSV